MHERLLQFIWANLYFRQENLVTSNQQPLVVLNPGHLNNGDGPDFQHASVKFDDLTFHGDVELHLESRGWFDHHHHEDPRYDKVVLHVVLDDDELVEARRTDQTRIPTLVLKRYVNESVPNLFRKSRRKTTLACAGLIKDVDPQVIDKQWKKANERYFNFKIQQLQKNYDSSLPPSEAWRHLLAESLFDGLGIASNRSSMRRLFRLLLSSVPNPNVYPYKDILEFGLSFSGLNKLENSGKLVHHDWSFSNTRPANQPDIRIPQAIAIWYLLWQLPLTTILNESINYSWQLITNIENMTKPVGSERKKILFSTVYLPAIHILGALFHDADLQHRAFAGWSAAKIKVPSSILGAFHRSGLTDEMIKDCPATVFQYKYMCREARCDECQIMKMILTP